MKNLLIIFIGIGVLSFTACKKYVEGINENPNAAADAPIENVLNGVFTGIITGESGEDARLGCMWAQQFTGSDRQYSSLNNYLTTAENFEWDKYYLVAKNCDIVIEKADASNNQLAKGIALIIKGHMFGTVAALFGDAPFAEANRFPAITNPKFDGQREVYSGVQKLLDDGIAALSGNPVNAKVASTDFYYGGSAAKWTAAAYSLKARYHLHTKNYADAIAAAAKGIKANGDNLMIPFANGVYNNDMNTYHSFGVKDRQGYMTAEDALLPALLDAANPKYRGNAKTNEEARFKALFSGAVGTYDLNYNSYWGASAKFPIITASEVALIAAECYSRTGDDMKAMEALNAARAANQGRFPGSTYANYEMADFASGGMANVAGKSASESLLAEIIEEKYISLVGQMEVFNDLRRTKNAIGLTPTTGSQLPARYLYPQAEINANANTPKPIPDLFAPTPVNQ